MFEKELRFFIANQDDLVARHRGKVLVIRDDHVLGVFPTPLAAYLDAKDRFDPGTYMIQRCEPGTSAYTVTIAPTG